jgi:hypothetical protein
MQNLLGGLWLAAHKAQGKQPFLESITQSHREKDADQLMVQFAWHEY